ncbi:adenylate kinase [Thermoplasmatales archaeon ex4484_30]|nr:MAG: adenylate kinase [Thermoplasmatales archaeon ex4484_30]
MVVILAGIPGAGKTTVITKALKEKDMKFVTYGTVMFEIAKKMGVKARDEIRKLPAEKQREIQKKAAEEISRMGDVIVDTHCTIKTKEGYLPGLPYEVLKKLNPRLIILVEASEEEIIERRTKDKDIRDRDVESIEEIKEHQLMNKIAAMTYAALTGATVKIVKNNDGMLEIAAHEVARALG